VCSFQGSNHRDFRSITKWRIEEVLQMLADSDTLIVTELSRLGRSTAEVIALVNELVARNSQVIILKRGALCLGKA